MKLLEVYSCASGAGMGYHQAGFQITAVDIEPQPSNPFEFHQGDAIEFIKARGHEFDAIHASPPCQHYSNLNAYNHKDYPDLIAPTRDAILATGLPYVIENVEAAAGELIEPVTLCGPMFGLRLYRHRVFETSFPLPVPEHPAHTALCARNGYLPTPDRPFMSIHGGKHSRAWQRAAADAMGMPWVRLPDVGGDRARAIREVCEAIPPAYTRHIGEALIDHLREAAA